MSSAERKEQVLDLVRDAGILRPRDLDEHGIPRVYLSRLHDAGLLERVGRGLYRLPDAPVSEHHSLALAAKRVPKGVVCLLSALRFHDLTTQAPHEVWLAIGEKARRPRVEHPPLHIVRFAPDALDAGIGEHEIEGVSVRVYNPAKTVADCFKYRHKIGLDVALEALRECCRARRCSVDDLWLYADICRVQRVMRPYMETHWKWI